MEFEVWLRGYLDSAGVDGEVFSGYITGTLSTLEGSSEAEIQESLLEVLQSCVEDEGTCLSVCNDIQKKWKDHNDQKQQQVAEEAAKEEVAVEPTATQQQDENEATPREEGGMASRRGLSNEEKRKLLEQYDCESEGEGEEDLASRPTPVKRGSSGTSSGVFVNTNTSVAGDAQRLHRELLKAEHDAKTERDRKDRETQKQKAQDRKDKEKKRTQKQEKRR